MTNPILFRAMPAISNAKRKVWFRQIKTFLLIFFLQACALAANSQCTYFTTVVSTKPSYHTLALRSDSTIWAWGWNFYGQLGDGTTINRNVPVQIGFDNNWVAVAASSLHSLAIKSDGTLWAWGNNSSGQLGIGVISSPINSPVKIGTASNWRIIVAGNDHSLAIKSDGTLWAWGLNAYGQLGGGAIGQQMSPVQIGTATNWLSIAGGSGYSLGMKSDSTLWAWGRNDFGQVGDGTNINKNIPVQLGIGTKWLSMATGGFHGLGIKADSSLWTWGINSSGELGDGTAVNKNIPAQALTTAKWITVAAGSAHSLGVQSDGTLWGWGYNGSGQLGNGTTINKNIPTAAAANWSSILTGGYYHSMGINTDGSLLGWGDNYYGSLGDGTNSSRRSPVIIGVVPPFVIATTNIVVTRGQAALTFYSSGCTLVAKVQQSGFGSAISGSTTAKVWIETTQPPQFVKRHYEIAPALNAATATGKVTLYFTQQEFNDFNAVNTIKLPANSGDATGKANLLIEKRAGVSSDGTGLPSTYTGTISTINPDDANLVWNNSLGRWEISFTTTGFSGFFLKTSSFVLPLRLISFTGNKTNDANRLQWQTADEINTKEFIVERSIDGAGFSPVTSIAAGNNTGNNYQYADNYQSAGKVFYRLKMVDNDGRFTYSNIIILSDDNNNNTLSLYPNPAGNLLLIETNTALRNAALQIADLDGRIVFRRQASGSSKWIANISALSPGIYIVTLCHDEKAISIKKLIKQ